MFRVGCWFQCHILYHEEKWLPGCQSLSLEPNALGGSAQPTLKKWNSQQAHYTENKSQALSGEEISIQQERSLQTQDS